MISGKNELFDKVSQIINSYDSCLISYSAQKFKNSELAEVQIIVFPKDFQLVLENRRMLGTGKIVIKADTVVTDLVQSKFLFQFYLQDQHYLYQL